MAPEVRMMAATEDAARPASMRGTAPHYTVDSP
jgi:hypothetical protein